MMIVFIIRDDTSKATREDMGNLNESTNNSLYNHNNQ